MVSTRTSQQHYLVKATWGGTVEDSSGSGSGSVYLPPPLLKRLRLKPGMEVLFKMGSFQAGVKIAQLPDHSYSESEVSLSPDLSSVFRLPAEQEITLRYNKLTNILSAGPLVGLFTVRNFFLNTEYGTQEPLLWALTNSSKDICGLVFVFCPEDINWEAAAVTGYIPHYDSNSGEPHWLPLTLPLPDVVYDRIPSRTIEARPEVQEAKDRLMNRQGLFYFNPMFLDKWETHAALSSISDVSAYLPPTRLVTSPEDIREALIEHGSIFLKPTSGSLGRRIIKLTKAEGQFKYIYRSRKRQTVQGISNDLNPLLNQLKPVMGSRTYIIQKNLNLAYFEDCTFDVRVLAQKDRFGNWRRTKIYARAAAPDSFLANLSDGARTVPIRTVLEEVFEEDFQNKNGLGERIRAAVSEIPPALERATGKVWGELGLDLGIDKKGRVWLIEVNSKPFRTLVSATGSITNIQRSLLRPLEFAKFLAGFYMHSPAEHLV